MYSRVAGADAWLFRPEAAVRMRPGHDQGTPVPMDEPLAANPPDGALLDYYLKHQTSSPIQLEIFDAEGKLVRRFASDDDLQKTNPKDVQFQIQWASDPKPLLAEAAMHRFIWHLRYPLPKGVRTSLSRPAGVQAVPGNYTVKLTANGKSSTQPLTIKLDPRVKTPQHGLARQFGQASKLAARLGEVSMALQQAGDIRRQLDARKKEAGSNTGLLTALQAVESKIEAGADPDSEADFGLLGLAAPGKDHEPLPKVPAALSGRLRNEES